jgi:hypothetical protein
LGAPSRDIRSALYYFARRRRGSGGITQVAEQTWKVDIEPPRDAVTGRRRRVSRTVKGTREEAELTLARLKVAGHQKRPPSGGTNASRRPS